MSDEERIEITVKRLPPVDSSGCLVFIVAGLLLLMGSIAVAMF